MKTPLIIFLLLQLLDIATTLIAIALGGKEQNPLVGHLMTLGTLKGLIVSKMLVIILALAASWVGMHKGIRIANFVFCAVVAWNFTIVARLLLAA